MANKPKLETYRLFYERIPAEIPEPTVVKKRPGRKPKSPRLPQENVLENLDQ